MAAKTGQTVIEEVGEYVEGPDVWTSAVSLSVIELLYSCIILNCRFQDCMTSCRRS